MGILLSSGCGRKMTGRGGGLGGDFGFGVNRLRSLPLSDVRRRDSRWYVEVQSWYQVCNSGREERLREVHDWGYTVRKRRDQAEGSEIRMAGERDLRSLSTTDAVEDEDRGREERTVLF